MKLGHSIKFGAWLLIFLNFLMALASIFVFMRMAPAIKLIIKKNEASLEESEKMLKNLALTQDEPNLKSVQINERLKNSFLSSLKNAKNNITENKEDEVLKVIENNFIKAFHGNYEAKLILVKSIGTLENINRKAMEEADLKARQLGKAGAWGVVFMATLIFFVGLLFLKNLQRSLVVPLEELNEVLSDYRKGETLRRCTLSKAKSSELKTILGEVNNLLDKDLDCQIDKKNFSEEE